MTGASRRSVAWRRHGVAVRSEVGEVLGAKMLVVMIGERAGLSSPDTMGIYITLNPRAP
jgi:ethanolamine ammonia-lyase small subunit